MSQQISSTMKTTDTVGVVQPEQLREIYDHFTESVRDLGNKAKGHAGSKKLGNSFMHWIGGGHIRTDRDRWPTSCWIPFRPSPTPPPI